MEGEQNESNTRRRPSFLSKYKWHLVGIVVVLVVIYVIAMQPPATSVPISGSLNATGAGTSITQLVFYNSNNSYSIPVGNPSVSGTQFSTSLPNRNATYKVVATWVGNYSWQKGTANSTLTFNKSSPNKQYALVFQTPASIIKVNGTAYTKTSPAALSSKITFISSNQSSLQPQLANVKFGGAFNLSLPNMVSYNVNITYTANAGFSTGNCMAGTLPLNIPPGRSSQSGLHYIC